MKMKLLAYLTLTLALAAGGRGQAQASLDYKIAPQDIIVIDVLGEKELTKECRVSTTGTINYFLLGNVEVGGKTTAAVKELLTELLNRDYLVDPQVTVDVKEYRVREVFVNGAVFKPGAVIFTGEQTMTILGAISRAGGLTVRANEKKIKFTRPGEIETKTFTWEQLKRQSVEESIKLQPGDIIEVDDLKF